jgi:hypothetical protein
MFNIHLEDLPLAPLRIILQLGDACAPAGNASEFAVDDDRLGCNNLNIREQSSASVPNHISLFLYLDRSLCFLLS